MHLKALLKGDKPLTDRGWGGLAGEGFALAGGLELVLLLLTERSVKQLTKNGGASRVARIPKESAMRLRESIEARSSLQFAGRLHD